MNSRGMFAGGKPHERAERPRWMDHEGAQPQPTILLTFHHIIAWDCLRDVWQGLIEHGRWDAIEAFLDAAGVPGAAAARRALERGATMDVVSDAIAFQKISWPAWDLVQGPNNRQDEVGTDVDAFVHGVPELFRERLTMVDLLWIAMKAFLGTLDRRKLAARREAARTVSDMPATAQPDNSLVNTVAADVARALSRLGKYRDAPPIPYIHSMWEVVGFAQVDPNARPEKWIGTPPREPRYAKARAPRPPGNLPPRMRCQACRQIYARPPVPPGAIIQCAMCKRPTYVDFKNAA